MELPGVGPHRGQLGSDGTEVRLNYGPGRPYERSSLGKSFAERSRMTARLPGLVHRRADLRPNPCIHPRIFISCLLETYCSMPRE